MTEELEKFAPKQGEAVSKWCVMEANDADEQAHNLKDWQQQYDQISNGRFYGKIEEVMFESIHAFREHTSQTVRQQCNVWPNAIWLGFSADDKSCRINGHHVSSDHLMIRPGSTQFELVTPEQFNIFGIVINQDTLKEVARLHGIELDISLFHSPLRVWHSEKLKSLRYLLNDVLKPQPDNLIRHHQEDILMMAVLEILQQNDQEIHEKPSFVKRRAVVQKVTAYLDARSDKPITITDMCALAYVSRRTLQYCFEDVLGISPLRYLRISRLNAVRRVLTTGLKEDETISMVAQKWGFFHAGQFTHDYTSLFGENPSVTVLRYQQQSPFKAVSHSVRQ
ncbi:MAG: helix-turn-helix domain-containing protein [Methylophaga nitratireducenticrescens]|uniref:helix-turn-helix domain-containing protein n=1 Tax=Methylophaga sp. SB9B TaxID=2570356 RepID=UPI0010A94808|nr:helix-turn-helix domain-containing protein [Methylophaga sp. SB9B]THF63208.1 MAG: helix-turn-helix domain-containing protein [Methylophaga nitratireducenticrescens]THK41754.1 helix-turn-helix domain-containing protein [Methylophaga sp. SB9B]